MTGIIRVMGWLVMVAFALWLVAGIVGPAVMEPLHSVAVESEPVQEQGYDTFVDYYLRGVLVWGPRLLAGGAVCLMITYAVFRESFSARGRPR